MKFSRVLSALILSAFFVSCATFSGRYHERGMASYYGKGFDRRKTASGELFNRNDLTAAHPKLPFGTRLRVRNVSNNETVVVRVNDRGPYAHGRIIDLSEAAARRLGFIQAGHTEVEITKD
jgi:rare lipoprotein A